MSEYSVLRSAVHDYLNEVTPETESRLRELMYPALHAAAASPQPIENLILGKDRGCDPTQAEKE